jgi:hypothetical protein
MALVGHFCADSITALTASLLSGNALTHALLFLIS